MDDGVVRAAGRRPRRSYVRYSAELGRAILARVAMGEALSAVCAEDGMPTHGTVGRW
ncbi:hypothetical protein, partial [uncultured Phenylobacterium sp.]|uniref:terminase small subunit-like protein n=1 Tax=uncultured Phenylobacterium sp. TaxID=349273 RepID=UPI00345DB9BD